jgi:putative ABC transport system permease protein
MPEDFRYLAPDKEIWIPFRWAPDALSAAFFRRAHLVRAVARLRDGVGPEEALEELLGVAAGLEASYPETNTGLTAGITPLGDWLVGDRAVMLRALASAVAILLIAAAVNVGYLVLVRRKRREAELAIRRALGAGQSEIFSDAAAEAALVSLIGAGLGVLGSLWGMRWLASAAPPELLGSVEPTPSVSLVLLSVGIVAVSALFFTILPTRLGPATSGSAAMTPGSRAGTSSARARGIRGFVTVQVALSTVLIFSAALLTRSFVTLRSVDPGFDASGVLTFAVPFPDGSDEAAPERARAARQIVRDLEGLDGVVSAGAVRQLPVLGNGWTSFFSVEGRAPGEGSFEIAHRGADAGYFESMRVPLVAGRHVQDDEVGVVVVNETFARRAFGSSEALGQRIAFTEEPSESSTWWTVVGVVGDELQNGLRVEARPEVITPYTWDVPSTFRFVARTSGDPLALLPWARQVVRSIDASLPLDEVASLDGIVRDSLARDRFMTLVAGAFAFLAGLLAVAGVYGVTAQAAASWQREFALRLAVGARPANLFRSVLRRGAALVGGGLALGALLAVWSTRFIEAFLFETSGSDLPSLALVTLVIAISGLLATVPSALRAMRTDPARSLSP